MLLCCCLDGLDAVWGYYFDSGSQHPLYNADHRGLRRWGWDGMRPAAAQSDACWHADFQMGFGWPAPVARRRSWGREDSEDLEDLEDGRDHGDGGMADGRLTASTATMLSTRRVAGPITARLIRARPITGRQIRAGPITARPPPEPANRKHRRARVGRQGPNTENSAGIN
jgi:hypothetical protein